LPAISGTASVFISGGRRETGGNGTGRTARDRLWIASAASTLAPSKYPILAAFSPAKLCRWIWAYLSHRIGRRHPFKTYPASDADQGVYKLDDDGEVRIALAGDWGTGTDEAACIAKLIDVFDPHYSIHLGDVYYVGDRDEVDENFLGIKNPRNEF
jgi:hypothetical protein